MDAEWVLATLHDVMDALEDAVGELGRSPQAVGLLLPGVMPAIYAKLNDAGNSRELGPEALDKIDHDALVGFPKDLPM